MSSFGSGPKITNRVSRQLRIAPTLTNLLAFRLLYEILSHKMTILSIAGHGQTVFTKDVGLLSTTAETPFDLQPCYVCFLRCG
jgi:hypothetical protein